MTHSNDLFERLSIMAGHNSLAKVTDIFPQKNLTMGQICNLDQIALNVCNFISYDPL